MQFKILAKTMRPSISALAVLAINAVLIAAIYFTLFSVGWITFLSGVLVAAVLAEATRVSRAEWLLLRRTAQFSAARERLDREIGLRKNAEEAVAAGKSRLYLLDEVLPTMVAFVDAEGCCRYHNRSFGNWLHLRPDQIDGRHLNDILGARAYHEITPYVRQSLDGHIVKYERSQTMPNGAVYKFAVEHVPQLSDSGKVAGFFMLSDDITEPSDAQPRPGAKSGAEGQELYVDAFSQHVTGKEDAGVEIVSAIEQNKFRLFCQNIEPLGTGHRGQCAEVLVRLAEEEEGMMPPGAFFPLAEKHGMMAKLDRWVVQHVAEEVARLKQQGRGEGLVFFINVAEATITDREFPDYLEVILLEHNVPGGALCFELPNPELMSRRLKVAEFAQRIRQQGCRIALSGFGRDKVTFDLIRGFEVDYLKIDGSVILNILRDPVQLAKIVAISEVAKKMGVQTIAEFVENEAIRARLREIGIDYAQGFGVAPPRPLAE